MVEYVNTSESGGDIREMVRRDIMESATFSWPYLMMNVLAAMIACYGLFADSPAVVIGAMLIAMLLGPITGVGLALVDNDLKLLKNGLLALVGGIAGVMIAAFVLGVVHRNIPLTSEIMARTSPNLIDLMIALAGGTAGAYATISPRLNAAVTGVAIATALVPPLAAASILFARAEIGLAFGAMLLAFTNIVGIQFAFSVVLWLSGFRAVTCSSGLCMTGFLKRSAVSVVILIALAVVLTIDLRNVIAREVFETETRETLRRHITSVSGYHLAEVRFEPVENVTIVRAVVRGPSVPTARQVAALESSLPRPPGGTKIELRIRAVKTMTISRKGRLYAESE